MMNDLNAPPVGSGGGGGLWQVARLICAIGYVVGRRSGKSYFSFIYGQSPRAKKIRRLGFVSSLKIANSRT